MIAKYPGICRYCRKPIEVGRDEYDTETKTNWHPECLEKQPPSAEQFELADRLGFIEWRPEMGSNGLLLRMSRKDRGGAARRPESAPRSRQNETLFEE